MNSPSIGTTSTWYSLSLIGDFFSILLVLILDLDIPFDLSLITFLIENFIEIEMEGGIVSILFAIFGAVMAVVYLGNQQKLSISKEGVPIFTEKKPFFDWSPRWIVPVKLSEVYSTTNSLVEKLQIFGFLITKEDEKYLRLEKVDKNPKVRLKGPKGKLTLVIPLPLKLEVDMLLLYSDKIYFDTGDLWKAAEDLKKQLQGTE